MGLLGRISGSHTEPERTVGAALFLDIDGVLLPTRLTAADHWRSWTYLTPDLTVTQDASDAALVFSPDLVAAIERLRSRGLRIVWATTWIGTPDLLRRLERATDLKADAAIPWNRHSELAKPTGVLASLVEDPTPFIWADDQLNLDWSQRVESALSDGIPCLLLHPQSRLGLEPDHIEQIGAFLNLVEQRSALSLEPNSGLRGR